MKKECTILFGAIILGYGITNYTEENKIENKKQVLKTESKPQKEKIIKKHLFPLAFDLNGDGLKTVSFDKEVYFDHKGDGKKELTEWIDPNDGILFLDSNMNDIVDSGQELFSHNSVIGYYLNNTPIFARNAIEALSIYDSNNDMIIDRNDYVYYQLKIWNDKNLDGENTKDEMLTLSKANIKSIDLNMKHKKQGRFIYTSDYLDHNNNIFNYGIFQYSYNIKKTK